MKKNLLIPLFTFTFGLHLAANAAVPLRWTVETSRATPVQIEAYQGETLDLEASLLSYGKPLAANLNDCHLYWQTNGMGSVYWTAPAFATNSHLTATWSPTNDVGARVYTCFIGAPGSIYHAAFQLRLRPSPGAVPNTLPLPQPIIDFAKIRVLNPPWGSGGIDTNAVRDIIHETVDGAARPLPPYLHALDFCDGYPEDAAAYYRSKGDGKTDGGCSAVRDGGYLSRNFDYPFDERAEFVVMMSAGKDRFASVGVAQVGTNLTEQMVTSGKPSRCYKWLPGATVDGINERGVCAEINVVDTPVTGWSTTGNLHPLAAVRWILDHATNAQHGAEYIASHIAFPAGWTQNFHYMVCDERETWIVENGDYYRARLYGLVKPILTNFRVVGMQEGSGTERYNILLGGGNITNVWYTNAYRRSTNPPWLSEFGNNYEYMNAALNRWNDGRTKEQHRGESYTQTTYPYETITWWQTVHTSVYDITNRVLRVSVQERPDWYVFQVPGTGGIAEEADPVALPRVVALETEVAAHTGDTTNNPHQVTAEQVGALRKTGDMMTGDLLLGTKDAESRKLYGVKYVDYSNDPPITNVLIDLDIGYFDLPLFVGLSEYANVLTAGRSRGGRLIQQINHEEDVGWKVSSFVKDSFYESYLIPDGSDFATMNMLTNANATTCAATSATNSLAWLATTAAARAETNSADIANLTATKMDKATSAASGYLVVFDDDGNAVKSSLNTMGGDNIETTGWIDAHGGFIINGYTLATVGDDGMILYARDYEAIMLPATGGTMALTSDIPPPPGDYAAVSNAAMWASNEVMSAASTIASHTSQLTQQSQSIADNAAAIADETARATDAEAALQHQIDLFKSFTAVVTNSLPATGEDGCIYLVPIADSENKAEWLWVHEPSNHWEKIGTTAIDMSDYAKSAELATEAGTRSAADSAHDAAIANLTAAKMDKVSMGSLGELVVEDASDYGFGEAVAIRASSGYSGPAILPINSDVVAYQGDVQAEIDRATSAEDSLWTTLVDVDAALFDELTARADGDELNANAIAAETARATAAEAAVTLAAKAYTDSVLGPISTALDAILGGH